MKVTFSCRALTQLDEIFAYVAQDNSAAAVAIVDRVKRLASLLGRYPSMGRTTDKAGVRVMSVPSYPYVIFYKVVEDGTNCEFSACGTPLGERLLRPGSSCCKVIRRSAFVWPLLCGCALIRRDFMRRQEVDSIDFVSQCPETT